MGSIAPIATASQVRLSKDQIGINGDAGPYLQPEVVEISNKLLQKNHDEHHIMFRDLYGHNHMAHCVLTKLAINASAAEIDLGFNCNAKFGQRPLPALDQKVVKDLYDEEKFYQRIFPMNQSQYTNFLVFFTEQINQKGWIATVQEFVFARNRNAETMLGLLYDGAFHSFIHLGLGVEFEQPSIIAEALAQAAVENSSNIGEYLLLAEQEAVDFNAERSLLELLGEVGANETIRKAPYWSDGHDKMENGVLGRSGPEITKLMAQFHVTPETLERRAAESISISAYIAGAAQRADKVRKIDFFIMHCVTSSIFLTVLLRQPWIKLEDKVRLVEWKGRIDLAWYATVGCPELDAEWIDKYDGVERGDWAELFRTVNPALDDGHLAKFVRSLKNGEDVSKPFLDREDFPVKGEMWLKLAWMAYDSTVHVPQPAKWVQYAGFDEGWEPVPAIQ